MERFEKALEKIGVMRFLIGVVVTTLVLGFTSGVSSVTFLQDLGAVPDTVKAHTEWIEYHDTYVAERGLARIDSLDTRLTELESESLRTWRGIHRQLDRLEEWTSELHCDRFPERCDAVPRVEDDSG